MSQYTLSRITGGTGSESSIERLNKPIEETEAILNQLGSSFSQINQRSSIVRQNVPLESGVAAGDLVYYNTVISKYSKALAAISGSAGQNGETVEAPSARVAGMVLFTYVAQDNSVSGSLLCGGFWESLPLAQACLGSDATAGTYYLSPTVAGKATKNVNGHLRQPVLTYEGAGKFSLSLFYMAHDNHFHASHTIPSQSGWLSAPSGSPAGATYYYAPSDPSDAFWTLGTLTADTTAVFYQGELDVPGATESFQISGGTLWCNLQSLPASNSVTLFNNYPFSYNAPVVRSVQSVSDDLIISNVNGVVTVQSRAYTSGAVAKSPIAISSIEGNQIAYTPVITELSAGSGIRLHKEQDGSVTVSSAGLIGTLLDAYSIQHNGTTMLSSGFMEYIDFPANRACQYTMTLPVHDVPSGVTIRARAWAIVAGVYGALNVSMKFIEQPTESSLVDIPATLDSAGSFPVRGEENKFSYTESTGSVLVTSRGSLVAAISNGGTASSEMRILRTGFILTVVSQEEQVPIDSLSAVTSVIGRGISSTFINQYKVVKSDNNGISACNSNSDATRGHCVGIALHSCAANEEIEYITEGILPITLTGATIGGFVYVGTDGSLTQNVTSGMRYVQRVGTVIAANAIQVRIDPVISSN